jgi:hypothetical protein
MKEIEQSNRSQSYKEMLVRDFMTQQKYNLMIIVMEKIIVVSHIFAEDNFA